MTGLVRLKPYKNNSCSLYIRKDDLSRGINPQTLAADYAKEFKVSVNAATNLLMTEYSQFARLSNTDCLNDLGVEEYEIIETLDDHTYEKKCREMDKKHFTMNQLKVVINAPPFHNRCRGTKCPYFNNEFTANIKRAARNPGMGETVYVDDMSYTEWKDKFVKEKGKETWDYYEKSTKNKGADKEQYEKYKSVLDKNAPKSLEEFQKLKYTNGEKWDELKSEVKGKSWLQCQLQYNYNGEDLFIPDKTIIENSRTIAGKGSKTEIRVVDKLVSEFGGKPEDWKKRVSKIESDKYIFDVHWYELGRIQYDMKLKYRGDK